MICSIWSAEVCTCSESWPIAALLTSASIGPSLPSTSLTNSWHALASVMSTEPKCEASG